jgi:hypothetical protein
MKFILDTCGEIYTLNDTLINNKSYRIVATRNLCQLWPDLQGNLKPNPLINANEFIFGGIREENKKVYFIKFNSNPAWSIFQNNLRGFNLDQEHLLYDFDVTPGDTIHFSDLIFKSIINGDTTIHIQKHFSKIIDQINPVQGHKRYEVANSSAFSFPWETGTLIEGIGSSYGLFGSYDSFLSYLICFEINGEALLFDQECAPCDGYVSTNNIDELSELQIYPNPTTGRLNITSQTNFEIDEIKIMDSVGKLMQANKYSSNHIELDLSNFYSGILLIHIKFTNGYELVKKVVKQ